MACLVLVRHGESEWNKKGVWTGLTDIPLSEKGRQESKSAGEKLKNIKFDLAFTSVLKRAKETLDEIKNVLSQNFQICESPALNERDYGVFTGKNKWEVKEKLGEEEFKKIRRGFTHPIEGGETLKDVYNRVIPYYISHILTPLREGKNVLICAHGNSLRALIKYLENISDKNIENLEIATGQIYIYQIDQRGNVISKEIKNYKQNLA